MLSQQTHRFYIALRGARGGTHLYTLAFVREKISCACKCPCLALLRRACLRTQAFGSQHACMKRSHDDLLRVSPVGLNTAALARVLLFAKREPELLEALPEGQDTLRANLSRRHHALAAALTRQVACGSYDFPQLHLPAAAPYFRDNLPGWEQALDAWRGQSPQVADAVYYLDETVPGNILSRDNRRKFYAVYLGLRAFRALLHAETFWMPLAIIGAPRKSRRSVVVLARGAGGCVS